jgi:hypothetical protein
MRLSNMSHFRGQIVPFALWRKRRRLTQAGREPVEHHSAVSDKQSHASVDANVIACYIRPWERVPT